MTDTLNYVFGYGSLIDRASRMRTNPNAVAVAPVVARNVARGWWINGNPIGFSTCFLAVQAQQGARCNGVVYPVTPLELAALDRREKRYTRLDIPPEDVTFLDGSESLPEGVRLWVYAVPDEMRVVPSPQYPIVQSYVDICLNGCFEMEDAYPLAKEVGYAEMFVTETRDWSMYWENDRIHARRPVAHTPRATVIDALLHNLIPEVFTQIQLQPARWDV
ncbi:MAG: gamma-glutamylcyclotransferase family protein [Chloroflexota bacterium]